MAQSPDESSDLLRRMLASMERWRASDLFVVVGRSPAVRVDGAVHAMKQPATTREQMNALVDEVLPPHLRQRFEETGDADVGYSLSPEKRFRLNFARVQGEASFVARALPRGDVEFAELGLPESLGVFATLSRGLVLVTGATGSGKSTTLAALIHRINTTRAAHIVTIEEPIEFVHRDLRSRISQREAGTDTRDFGTALRSVLRQSPDVIVIGEMRDLDTMRVALSAALTGHLVFATVHTTDATQTLQRIVAYFPEEQREQACIDLSLSLKSTTLACMVDRINSTRACRILTVEDPIEYTHEGKLATVDQREVHADTLGFAAALKYVLRQDPDVILVGEMRDRETIGAAITAAETGHLVLATLHTNDAIGAIDRIIDVFPEYQQAQVRSQLAAALLGVISQRLLPRVGGGRIGVFEVMVANTAIRTQIRDNKMHQALSTMEANMADGMVTMDRALRELYQRDLISYDDATRYARNPKSIL